MSGRMTPLYLQFLMSKSADRLKISHYDKVKEAENGKRHHFEKVALDRASNKLLGRRIVLPPNSDVMGVHSATTLSKKGMRDRF